MKILLTGASGLVGSVFARSAAACGHEVIGIVGRWSEHVPGVHGLLARDLTTPGAAAELVRGIRPDAIVNAAALSEPAACAADPVTAELMNVGFPAALAACTAADGTRLLHLSSEQVFDGEHPPHGRDSVPRPLNLYGRQKWASEQRVLAAAPAAAVLRLPLLLGNSLTGRRSVHEKFFEAWSAGRVVRLYEDEIRQACSADSVARVLLHLLEQPRLRGVFHWAGAEPLSRWDMGRRIAAHLGVPEKWIAPMRRADTPDTSPQRPRDLTLDLAPLDREPGLVPETLDAVLPTLRRPTWAAGLRL